MKGATSDDQMLAMEGGLKKKNSTSSTPLRPAGAMSSGDEQMVSAPTGKSTSPSRSGKLTERDS